MIREAQLEDVPRLLAMGQRFIAESSYRGKLNYNPTILKALMERLIKVPEGAIFVAESKGYVSGMIGVFVYTHAMSGERIASEAFWWVEPEQRGSGISLIRAAEKWATDQKAVRLCMIAPNDKVARAYQIMGYSKLEEHYDKKL